MSLPWKVKPAIEKRRIPAFLTWASRRGLCSSLAVHQRRSPVPSTFTAAEQPVAQLRRFLTEEQIRLDIRVAASLIVLYGLRASQITTLTTADLTTPRGGRCLTLGDRALRLPPRLANLIQRLIDRPH